MTQEPTPPQTIQHPAPQATAEEVLEKAARKAESPGGQLGIAEEKVQVDRGKIIDWIEIDLWRRFEKRLWAVVSIVLTMITVAGIFGVPYYINSEMSKLFATQADKFSLESQKLISMIKAYARISGDYMSYMQEFREDVAAALHDVSNFQLSSKQHALSFGGPGDLFRKLLLIQKYDNILHEQFLLSELNSVSLKDYSQLKLSHQETINLENRVIDAVGGTSAPHPYRNGDLRSFYTDLKLRIVILASYERALADMEKQISRLGGIDELSSQTRGLEADASGNSFDEYFSKYLKENAAVITSALTNANSDASRPGIPI